jgi:hypothetical protein
MGTEDPALDLVSAVLAQAVHEAETVGNCFQSGMALDVCRLMFERQSTAYSRDVLWGMINERWVDVRRYITDFIIWLYADESPLSLWSIIESLHSEPVDFYLNSLARFEDLLTGGLANDATRWRLRRRIVRQYLSRCELAEPIKFLREADHDPKTRGRAVGAGAGRLGRPTGGGVYLGEAERCYAVPGT